MSETIALPTRKLYDIAAEIKRDWRPTVNVAAMPYLDAMLILGSIDDRYISDDARSIVAYFLCNASSWKGPTARRIKAELKAMSK